jgi:hypothetical protein
LVDAYEIGAIEIDDLKARSDAVRVRIERARRDLADAERRLCETTTMRAIITRLDAFAARVRTSLDGLPWSERRQIIRTLVAKIEIGESAATIVYRVPSTERLAAPPSGSERGAGGEDGSKGDSEANCRLRSQGSGLVTRDGPSAPLDPRTALRPATRH